MPKMLIAKRLVVGCTATFPTEAFVTLLNKRAYESQHRVWKATYAACRMAYPSDKPAVKFPTFDPKKNYVKFITTINDDFDAQYVAASWQEIYINVNLGKSDTGQSAIIEEALMPY